MKPELPVNPKSVLSKMVATVVLVLVAVSAFIGYTLIQSQQRYRAEARNTSRNLALALEHALHSHFEEVELSLRQARREFSSLHDRGEFTPERYSAYLRSLRERMPQAQSIRGTDERGRVVYGDDVDPAKPLDLTIREFYQRATTERELVFGVPLTSRISGRTVFPLIYALTYPDGRFGGSAYVSMDNEQINGLIAALKPGPHGVISLVDTRRRLLHRFPQLAGAVNGQPLPMSPEFTQVLASGAGEGKYEAVSKLDGERREYAVRRIGSYPVYITVGLSERDFLAPWYGEVRNACAFLLVLVLLASGLLAGVRSALTRKRATMRQLVLKEESLQASLAALTRSEARFRALTEGLPQMVWTLRADRQVDFLSHHWAEFTGLTAQQLAQPRAFRGIVHADDQARIGAAWQAALTERTTFHCDCRMRRHDGVWLYFDNRAQPQFDAGGAIAGWVGSSTDISERHAAHDALMLAKDQALAAGRAKSDFLANMSHEIRSPMNAVLGLLQLLQRTPLEALQRDYAVKAEISARALLGILNDILDFSKIEEGKLALDPHPFSVDQLLRELAVILSSNASGKEVEVLFSVSPALPGWVEGDKLRLQQVLLNLAGNAIKFTERGEVLLSVEVGEAGADTIEVRFCVRDTGIGIAADKLAHIFDGFSQAEASTARRFGGTGLGLAISQRLVGLMGGVLTVHSKPGQGSSFAFSIAMRRTAQQSERAVSHALRYLRCLVVDDNATGREVLCGIVRSFGWRADSVAGGDEALAVLAAQVYDVVLIDYRMPGLDGWETSRRLRAMALPGAMPMVVMVTAHDRDLIAATGGQFAPRLDAMLAKPVTASVLFDTISAFRLQAASANGGAAPALAAQGTPATDARLEGLRLLVVDDNAINLQVARELLRGSGAQVDVATGGHAALEAVCGGSAAYHLVLMDIQMPDMDGYATTAAIKERIGSGAPPIVAMTANAMSSDRDAAHAAGMADHVGKPFDLEQLIGVILRHARSPAPAATLNLAAALARLGGSTRVYHTALRGFEGEMDKLGAQLANAMEGDDAALGKAALHTMRGLAGLIGADQLADAVRAAERDLAQAGAQRWRAVPAVLAAATDAVRAAGAHLQEQ